MKTTEQVETEETQAILTKIDEYVWYGEGAYHKGTRAKSGQVIGTLVKILVAKGLLTVQDVDRILE